MGVYRTGFIYRKNEKGDKVIISCFIWWNSDWVELVEKLLPEEYKGDLTEVYLHMDDPIHSWLEGPAHCNGAVNKKIAERIWDDLCKDGEWIAEDTESNELKELQDYYIPYEIHKYFDEYIYEHSLYMKEKCKVGAIIMNCNPFTKGHKYLIEKAREMVDFLYVFVVEEDKSYYSFKDRFEMVKRGVSDLNNIKVLPSGNFILSKDTFAQYFDKESITEVEDMSWDIRIFGEVVAKELGITYRFVGEEPKDIVTREYNETMKRILPEYGINVIEIPRISTPDRDVISATTVRKLIQVKDWEGLEKYCPKSTIEFLKGKSEG